MKVMIGRTGALIQGCMANLLPAGRIRPASSFDKARQGDCRWDSKFNQY